MSPRSQRFVFIQEGDSSPNDKGFIIKILSGIRIKRDLLENYEREGRFPGYFGRNWDALLDCLRDFSWVTQRRVIILHEDLPLQNDKEELQVYLEILNTAIEDWSRTKRKEIMTPPHGMIYIEHELIVAFPAVYRTAVDEALGQRLDRTIDHH